MPNHFNLKLPAQSRQARTYHLWVDGSFRRKHVGGWGAYIRAPGHANTSYYYGAATVLSSPEAEILGLLEGLRLLPSGIEVTAHSDFQGIWQWFKQRQRERNGTRRNTYGQSTKTLSLIAQRIQGIWDLVRRELERFKRVIVRRSQESPRNLTIAHELSQFGSDECERQVLARPSLAQSPLTQAAILLGRFRAQSERIAELTNTAERPLP